MPALESPSPLHLRAGHLLVPHAGGLAVLDTGSPTTLPAPAIVADELGLPVATIIGCDAIGRAPIALHLAGATDTRPGTLVPFAAPHPLARAVRLSPAFGGVPLVDIEWFAEGTLAGVAAPAGTARAVLDTGAALSYAPAHVVAGRPVVRTHVDFLPAFGTFAVDVHELDVAVAGERLTIEVGTLPPLLATALALVAPDGWILGSALFLNRSTRIDLAGGWLHLGPAGVDLRAPEFDDDAEDARPHPPVVIEPQGDASAVLPPHAAPAAAGTAHGIAWTLRHDAVALGRGRTRVRTAVTLTPLADTHARPVALALALDVSGSMSGDRIALLVQAAHRLVDRLPAGTRLGIVAFNNAAHVRLPVATLDDAHRARAHAELAALRANGGTALFDGWRVAAECLDGAQSHGMLERVLLLSDGHANHGITDHATLADRCAHALACGITTATIGIGDGYDEDLLRAMARGGSGGAWYIPDVEAIAPVLDEELAAATRVVAVDAHATVTAHVGTTLRTTLGGLPAHALGADPAPATRPLALGELAAGVPRTVVAEWIVDAHRPYGDAALGALTVVARTIDGGDTAPITLTIPLAWHAPATIDPAARRAWLDLAVADARRRAMALVDAHSWAEALALVTTTLAELDAQPAALGAAFTRERRSLEALRHRLVERRVDSRTRKTALARAEATVAERRSYEVMMDRWTE